MSEFNNRVAAQRDILVCVNSVGWDEELFGLSRGAIERWIKINKVDQNSCLVELLKKSAEKLFFLSNKSQEQVTEEYKALSSDVYVLIQNIKKELHKNQQ